MYKSVFTITLLVLLFVFFGCKEKHQSPQKIAEIIFPVQNSFDPVAHSLQSDCGNSLFAINVANEIQIFEFDTGGIHLSCRFTLKNNPVKLNSLLFIKSIDSIFVFDNHKQTLILTDSSGTFRKEMLLSEEFPVIVSSLKLACGGNHVFLGNSSDTLEWGIDYVKQVKPIYQVTLLPDQGFLSQTFGFFPKKYHTLDFHDFYPTICPVKANELLFSYACDDSIYVLKNGEKAGAFPCRSKYIDSFTPFDPKRKNDMVYLKDYMALEPRYLDITYNPYKNQFYRIALHRKHYDKNHQITSATWSLIVMNEAYQVTNEYLFEMKKASCFPVIPAKEGFYIQEATQTGKLALSLYAL